MTSTRTALRFPFSSASLAAAFLAAAIFASPFAHSANPAQSQPADDPSRFLRVTYKPGKLMSLDIAARTYKRADGAGPVVALVGAVHIGDASYYRDLQSHLDAHPVVLFESVRPPGTGPTAADNDAQRAENTSAALGFLAGLINAYQSENHALPKDLPQLLDFARAHDVRLAQWVAQASTDGWGNPLRYAPSPQGDSFSLQSFGADNQPGGEGHAQDLLADLSSDPYPLSEDSDNGIQAQLASAFKLQFQLHAIDYGKDSWRCSDMSVDQVQRELTARGSDFTVLAGTLAGSSLPAQFIKLILQLVKIADSMTEGAVTDMLKIMMIELLSDPVVSDQGLKQLGQGFTEVIVDLRNQTVIDDLAALIQHEPLTPSVAIFYGAAHMKDMAQRLHDQLDYQPTGEVLWFPAISVDIANSALHPRDVRDMRLMVRQMIRQQFGRSKPGN